MLSIRLPDAPGYLVALSGGADSRLLLELTVRAVLARGEDPGQRVRVAHLHHGIRGTEADRDEAFCRRICTEAGVPLTVEHIDVPAICAKTGESEETAARRVRYDFFVRTMQAHGIPILLTAHNADDQLETLLARLLRGSGLHGMGGIPPTRLLGGSLPDGTPLSVVRPLLAVSRREIVSILEELNLTYVTDSTNLTDTCTRNRLRHGVTPTLETIAGPGVPQRAATRLTHVAREDEEALAALAMSRYRASCTNDGRMDGGLPTRAVASEMPAIAKRMIALAYADFQASVGGDPSEEGTLSATGLEDLLTLCREGRDGAVSTLLPTNTRGEIRDGYLVFAALDTSPALPLPAPRPLTEGRTLWAAGNAVHPAVWVEIERANAPISPLTGGTVWASAVFPADQLPLPLYARPRAPGDGILSHGMTKKLKKLLCDKHIPNNLRDRLPLICTDGGITPLWFPGVVFRDGYPPPKVGPALRITLHLISASPDPH